MKHTDVSDYQKPKMTKLDNLTAVTMDCPDFQCSIGVPPPPPNP